MVSRLYSVSPLSDLTGAPISALNHARLLRDHFESVCLVLPAFGEIQDRAAEAGLEVLLLPIENRGLRSRFFRRSLGKDIGAVVGSRWRYFRALCREFRRAPGMVHVHSLASIAPLALVAARVCGRPAVLHIRESPDWFRAARLWAQALAGLASSVVFVSDGIRQGYGARIRRRAQVIHNFMDMPPLSPPNGNAVPRMVMVGLMVKDKGTDVFLQVCRRLRNQGMSFDAWMVGLWLDAAERAAAERFLRENHLEAVVSIHGVQPQMEPVYAQMDVLLLPTRRDSFPRVVMEAMCHGIPVVATRVGGTPEMVEDGVTGFLVESEDVEGFEQAVQRLLEDSDLRLRMGAAARERAKILFSPEKYTEKMLALYREIGGFR